MNTLPALNVVLCDGDGAPFGVLRLAPSEKNPRKGDCIFDITPASPEQAARSEVRWLHKQRYKRRGEHRFVLNAEGQLTVSQADFKVVFAPDEEGLLLAQRPMPPVSGYWE